MYYIKPAKGFLTSLFSNSRKNPVLGVIRPHQGIDISSDNDNTIIAAASGKVRIADNVGKSGFGKYVIITHPNGQETVYAHLSAIAVKASQNVTQGYRIGTKGTTGNSTGIHLHFEVCKGRYTNNFKDKLDPLLLFFDPVTKDIQEMLNQLGERLIVDGIYGDATISAVSRYQKKHGLAVDGACGRITYNHMKKTVSTTVKPKPPVSDVTPKPSPTPPKPNSKEEEKLELSKAQREEIAAIFKLARQKGIFTSSEHEKSIVAGTMTMSRLLYLQSIIAGAGINNGKRVK